MYAEEPLHTRKRRKTSNSIGGRSGRQKPRLEQKESNRIYRKTTGLEIAKRIASSSVGL
jgi:hypothetical protein